MLSYKIMPTSVNMNKIIFDQVCNKSKIKKVHFASYLGKNGVPTLFYKINKNAYQFDKNNKTQSSRFSIYFISLNILVPYF